MIGRWIDMLPPHAKDRIVEAQLWKIGGFVSQDGHKCVIGHAEDWNYTFAGTKVKDKTVNLLRQEIVFNIAYRFDRLVLKHGMTRIVRACKMRAAKPQPVITVIDKPSHVMSDKWANV